MSNPGQKNKSSDIKKTSTLENKHRLKLKEFENGASYQKFELVFLSRVRKKFVKTLTRC